MGLVNSHLRPDTHLTPKKAFSDDNVFKNERKKKKNKNKKIEGNNHKNNLDVNNYKNDNERKEENRNNKNEKNNNINDNKEKNHQNKNEKNHPKLQNPFYTPQISRQQNDCQQEKHQQLNISSSISQQNQHNNVVYRRKQTSNVNIPNYYHANNIDQNYPHRSNNNNINNINNNNERNNSNNNNNKNNNNENFSNEVSSPLSLIISHELNRDIFQFIKQPANNKNNDAKNNSKNTNNCSHIFQKLEKQKNEKNGNKNSNKQNGIQSSSAKRIAKDESRQEDLVLLHKLIRKTNTHDYKEVCNMVRSSSCYYIADFLESLERLATLDRESLTSPSTNFINDIGSVKNGGSLQHEDNKGFMKDYDLIRSDGVSTGGINIDGKNTLGNESKLCASAQKSQNVDYECPGAVTKHSANYSPACNDIKQDVNSSQYSFDFTSHRKIPNGAKGPSSCIILPSPHPFPQSPFSPPTLLVSQNTIGHHFNPPFMISAQADEDTLDSGNINKNDVRTVHKTSCGLCDERGLLEMVEEHKNRIKDEINSKQDIFQKKLVNGPVSNKPANNTFPKNKCNQIYSNNKKTNTNNKYNNNNNKNNNNNNRNNNENINNTEDNYNDKNNTEDINEGKNNDNIVIDFFYIDKETKRKVNSIAQVIEMKKNKYCWKEGVIDGRDDRKLRDSGFNADEHELFNKNYRKKNPMYERYLLNINKESQGNNVFNTNSHLSINNNNINIYNNNSSTNICNINSDQNNKQTLTPRCPRDIIFNTTNKIQRPISLCVIPDTSDRFIPACALSMRHKCLCEKQSRRLCHVMEGRECCVVEVFIESCKVSVSSAMLLGKTFLYNDSLKVLKMTSCCLEDDHVMGLSQGICKNASLGCVDLSWNKITSRGVVYLCGALKKNKSVWSVVLDGNHLSDAGAESFAKLLKSSKISKTDKENVNDENDDECGYRKNIPQTRGSLKEWGNFCSLKSLSLKDNKISIRGTTSILKALKSNMYLSDLNLSGNFVHSTAMQHLADSLLTNRSLKLLRLDNCHVTDSGCKSLTRALKTNLDLNFLSLDCNCITDEGVESISEALKLNRGLRELSLNFCKVSEVGLDMLVSSVRFNSKLRCIRLCFNNINFHQDLTNNSLSNLELSYRNDNFQNFEKNFRKKELELKELNALEALEGCLKEEDLQWVDGRNHAKLNEKVTFFRHKSFKQRLFMALKRNPSFRIII